MKNWHWAIVLLVIGFIGGALYWVWVFSAQ
ncbi:hypothetical protein BCL52_2035 [Salisediminibacterium halotolerans]|uniref:Uncharacterized protein n=1 Tax=Salisediminibacterium halotolerans TaxID=517425 RepID=A0A1H9SN40_9BACI|nr:hypothetical protein BCL39_2038 [Actinophytocola xinjiangensis]RPE86703.1 hypothetical protein EDD67_2161 [Salisediminibacterium halotolerans]TWG34078.1 hypothetical protein BCL52_2035 [Salisediminibacterium halotolerans]SER86361.1 hypothetical protein SAMN05444126_10778 [Salisediminibacterium haloalkalitolerans]